MEDAELESSWEARQSTSSTGCPLSGIASEITVTSSASFTPSPETQCVAKTGWGAHKG